MDGRSFIAANLAVTFAQLGHRTLLVDADMRSPKQHLLLGIENTSGLSGILAGRGPSSTLLRVMLLKNLSVLTAGAIPPNPNELLAGSEFKRLLETYKRSYDIVILDTAAAATAPESITVCREG